MTCSLVRGVEGLEGLEDEGPAKLVPARGDDEAGEREAKNSSTPSITGIEGAECPDSVRPTAGDIPVARVKERVICSSEWPVEDLGSDGLMEFLRIETTPT